MSTTYKIKVNGSTADAFTVDIASIACLALPAHIALSILPPVKKISRISEYMNSLFVSDDPKYANFRSTIATIVKHAKEKGTLNIVCKHKHSELHTKSFIKYLSDNAEMIDMLSSYILNSGFKTAQGTEGQEVNPEGMQEMGSGPEITRTAPIDPNNPEAGVFTLKGQGIDRLSEDDISQITRLMNEQQIANDSNREAIEDGIILEEVNEQVTDVVARDVVDAPVVDNQPEQEASGTESVIETAEESKVTDIEAKPVV